MIEVADLRKTFRPPGTLKDLFRGQLFQQPVTALAGVSLRVKPGEIVCIMGPNGAGKTTLLRILAGLLAPSAGHATVGGRDATHAGVALRRDVSYVVGDERTFLGSLSGRENLAFFGALHGLPHQVARQRIDALLDFVGLTQAAHRRFSQYSRGMKQRLAIARGLMGNPRVLLLDEPTLGLDPLGAQDLRHFLRQDVLKDGGRTALVGSNDPAEVRALADRVLFLEAGVIRAETDPSRVEETLGLRHV